MVIYLEGETDGRRESAGPDAPVYTARAGMVTGMLPFSRMTHYTITARAVSHLRVARIAKSLFPEMLNRIPALGPRLVGILSDRIREVTKLDQAREKLASLGKLSAGLAHELNNPAAAAARAANTLRTIFDKREQASLEIDRQIGNSLTIDIGYLFVGAHRLVLGNGLNTSCPVGTSKPQNPTGLPFVPGPPFNSPAAQGWLNPDGTISNCSGTPQLLAGKPFFTGNEFSNGGFLDYNISVVNANYHGLTLQGIERLGKYFSLNANYTYSHIIDNGNFTTFINLPQNQFDNRSERGNSNQDVRHRFIANFSASTPNHGFALYRNLGLSSIITVQSGRPFTMFVGGDANGDTNPVTDRVGLSGRNSYIGQPLRSWDLRVSRAFQMTEHMRFDFAFDAFNVLNRQNVDEVFSVYGSPIFCGPVPQHFGDIASVQAQAGQAGCPAFVPPPNAPATFAVPPTANANFGTPRTMLNPRQLQFSAKFTF